jgi:hypothetical protein
MRRRLFSRSLALKICRLALLLGVFSGPRMIAAIVTWKASPATGDWLTASNWVEKIAPSDYQATATFGASNVTAVSLSNYAPIDGIKFNAGADPFTITVASTGNLAVQGVGLDNASGATQTFAVIGASTSPANGGSLSFRNGAAVGPHIVFMAKAGDVSGANGGNISFHTTSTAGTATFINDGGNNNRIDAGNGGSVQFSDASRAGEGIFTNHGGLGSSAFGGIVSFSDTSTAESGVFTNDGAAVSGAFGGGVYFYGTATAGNGIFINNGGTTSGAEGGRTTFTSTTSAGSATLIANGGTNGGRGGAIMFQDDSTGGTAAIKFTATELFYFQVTKARASPLVRLKAPASLIYQI